MRSDIPGSLKNWFCCLMFQKSLGPSFVCFFQVIHVSSLSDKTLEVTAEEIQKLEGNALDWGGRSTSLFPAWAVPFEAGVQGLGRHHAGKSFWQRWPCYSHCNSLVWDVFDCPSRSLLLDVCLLALCPAMFPQKWSLLFTWLILLGPNS